MLIKISALLLLLNGLSAQGDPCKTKSGLAGTCMNIRRCQPAIEDVKKRLWPQICGFEGTDPMVCCIEPPVSVDSTSLTTSTSPPSTSNPVTEEGGCEALSSKVTAPKTGRKAWDKCIEYQSRLVYPCRPSILLANPAPVRMDLCGKRQHMLIPTPNGFATPGDYPHLVLLGVGDSAQSAQWICGGSIISENFVLTSGSCTGSQETGHVTFVRLGVQNRSEPVDLARTYKAKRVYNHPDNKPPHLHNDIALVETEASIKLDHLTVPACLHTGDERKGEAIVVGWIGNGFENEGYMQKTMLNKMNASYCASQFFEEEGHRITVNKYNPQTQLCYIHHAKNSCRINDGGPLMIDNVRIKCMYDVVGVTAFAQSCGVDDKLVYYTKVSGFVPWIESIVWPDTST